MRSGSGSAVNHVKIGRKNRLHGNPAIKTEKPHTIIHFPGGSIEVARTTDRNYWVHIEVTDQGRITSSRIDAKARYDDQATATLQTEIEKDDVCHIAFLVEQK